MTFKYVAICAIFFLGACSEVASWTIDLPEVRKYFFSKYNQENLEKSIIDRRNENSEFYDNIDGNSMDNSEKHNYVNNYGHFEIPGHNELNPPTDNYADDYKYQGYMEKKVQNALQKGTAYLDGLRYSIERYTELLKNCSRTNITAINWNDIPSFNFTEILPNPSATFSSIPPNFNFTGTFNGTSYTDANFTEILLNFTRNWNVTCRRATEKLEQVRRLADLALWATKRLEDSVYADKYHKHSDVEENEMILRLAWYLDRLAHFTGFDPNVEDTNRGHVITTTTHNQPQLTTPDSNQPPSEFPESIPAASSLELLIAASSKSAGGYPPNLTAVKNPAETLTDVKTVRKRSIDETAMLKLIKYYVKHKAWANSNPIEEDITNHGDYDVSNSLPVKSVQKRSLVYKKARHLRATKQRLQGFSKLLKKKGEIHYPKAKFEAIKIKEFVDKMRKSNTFSLINNLKHKIGGVHDLTKDLPINIHKRSIDAKNNIHMKLPEDPMQDISKYIKNKAGVHYNNDKTLAERIRDAIDRMRNITNYSDKVWRAKRSVVKSNVVIHNPPHYPEEGPIHKIGNFIKHKAKIHLQKKHERAHKIKETLEKLYHASVVSHNLKILDHHPVHKRSVQYKNVYLPRVPEDPFQDISYYIKNKKGTVYNRNPVQAALVRAGLEQVFQTGNIEVIRRYGSNYIPGIPNAFYFGIMRSLADI
ncbi:uncharacterized protein LOC131840847 [Achroia grisella]|uniref:uncharacterized protein LOC131840847 n=1 Tax=Achroia grisella TaxID=688607 RepID=UPI0027D31924|nr:uncharacterized protein LOC131840847 [Achroia grisella]